MKIRQLAYVLAIALLLITAMTLTVFAEAPQSGTNSFDTAQNTAEQQLADQRQAILAAPQLIESEASSVSFPISHTVTFTTDQVGPIEIADLDGDNDLDIVFRFYSEYDDDVFVEIDTFAWYENNGMQPPEFTYHTLFTTSSSFPDRLVIADLNGDDHLDLITGDDTWYENDGATDPSFIPRPLSDHAQLAADIDGDDDLDLFTAFNIANDPNEFYENDGSGNFSTTSTTIPTWLNRQAVGHMNSDQDIDLIGTYQSGGGNVPAWWENDGNGNFAITHTIAITPYQLFRVLNIADADGDDDLDIFYAATPQTGDISLLAWFENAGNGNFSQSHTLLSAAEGSSNNISSDEINIQDLDNDDDLDILINSSAALTGQSHAWYENDGAENPTFTPQAIIPKNAGQYPNTADLDGDGDTDIILSDGNQIVWYEQGPVASPPTTLSIDKTAHDLNGGDLHPGDVIEYKIMVKNITNTTQTGVVITDDLLSYTSYVADSASITQGSVSGTDPIIGNVGDLAPGEYAILSFRVLVDPLIYADNTWPNIVIKYVGNWAEVTSSEQTDPIKVGPIYPSPKREDADRGQVQHRNPVFQIEQGIAIYGTAQDLNGGSVQVGDEIEFTGWIVNNTSRVKNNVLLSGMFPAHTTYITDTASATKGTSSTGLLGAGVQIGNLAIGEAVTLTFRSTIDSDAGGQILYTLFTVQDTYDDGFAGVNSYYHTGPIYIGPGPFDFPDPGPKPVEGPEVDQSAISLEKTADDLNGGPLYPGDVIEYKLMVKNITTTTQSGVEISDSIPEYTTYVAGSASLTQGTLSGPDPLVATIGDLAPDEYAILTFQVTVDENAVGQTIGNEATAISDDEPDPIPVGPIYPFPDPGPVKSGGQLLEIVKTADDLNGSELYVGDVIEYRIMVKNITTTAQSGIFITDAIPANTTYVPDSAWVTQGNVSGPDPIVADIGTLGPDEYAVLTFQVTVDSSGAGQTIGNEAEAVSDEQEPVTDGPIYPHPGPTDFPDPGPKPVKTGEQLLEIVKTAEDLNGGDLYAGDEIEYQVMVRNLMPTTQSGIVISDAIPANTTYVAGSASLTQGSYSGPDPLVANVGDLAADEYAILTFRVTVNSGAEGETIGNKASAVSDDQPDPVSDGPIYPFPEPTDFPDPGPKPVQPGEQLLSITKRAVDLNGNPLYVGDTIEYEVVVSNISTEDQTNVVISDPLPAHTTYVADSAAVTQGTVSGTDPLVANIGTLAAGESATFTFRVTVDDSAAGLPVTNQASATSDDQDDPIFTSDIPTYPTPFDLPDPGPKPVLAGTQLLDLQKSAEDVNGSPINIGDEIEYKITVQNITTTAQSGVVITDAIPAYTEYVADSASVTQGSISGPDPLVATIGTLAPQQTVTFTFRVSVTESAGGKEVVNSAEASSDQQDEPIHVGPVTPSGGGEVVPDLVYYYCPFVSNTAVDSRRN